MTQRTRRRGFTLLEMILALLIGLLLMGAVYTMFGLQFMHSKTGRDAVNEATIVRAVLTRISRDIGGVLGPYDPKQVPEAPADSTDTTGAAAPPAGTLQFNYGVTGDGGQLVLTVSRVPREVLGPETRRPDVGELPKVCDLRRITYWMVEGKGLAYQEVKRITSQDADALTDETDHPIIYIPEVKSISFQYWDGAGWTPSWASDDRPDGDTPIGPPAAIEIVLEMQNPQVEEGESPTTRKYRHVISVPTGNNYSTQTTQ